MVLVGCASSADVDGDETDTPETDVVDPVAERLACLADAACDRWLVVAHRGFHRDVPENSLASVTATAEIGADLVEIDVRQTSDGVLVVMHDGTVDRTTDGSGDVEALTFAEIEALTLDGGDGDPATSKVPTLADALAEAMRVGVGVYLDTKTSAVDALTQAVIDAGAEEIVLVRKDAGSVGPAHAAGLKVLVPVDDEAEIAEVQASLPGVVELEVASVAPQGDLVAAIRSSGARAQQDLFAADAAAVANGPSGFLPWIDTGVRLLQTEYPDRLVPVVQAAIRDGAWPTE